jgi:hypothetical protein
MGEGSFFPAISFKRLQQNYYKKAILIIDGFGAHHTPIFELQCSINNVIVKFLVPHSSDRCQPLDAITFSSLKRSYSSIRCDKYESKFNNQIVRMMRAWSSATSNDLVVQTFRAVGISPYLHQETRVVYCNVDLESPIQLKSLCDSHTEPGIKDKPAKKAKREKLDS